MRYVVVSLLLLIGQGCVTSDFMPVGGKTYPPRAANYVIDVYVPLSAPVVIQQSIGNAKPLADMPAGARVIGRIDTDGAPAAGWGAVIDNAKKHARELGGDAIVINQWGSPLTGVNGYGQAYHGKAISMNVMRFGD